MRPNPYDDDYMVIDSALDHPIFPAGIHQGIDVLAPGVFQQYDFDDAYADFPEIDYYEHRERWQK